MRGQFSPLPAPLPRFALVLPGQFPAWAALPPPPPPSIISPCWGSPGPVGQPPRLSPRHTHQGVSVPPQASRNSRGYPIPNCGRLPAGSAGGCGQGGRGARHPPEVTVPATPMPRSLRRTEPRPPRCAQVRSAAPRELRAGGRGAGLRDPGGGQGEFGPAAGRGPPAPGLPGWGRKTGDTHTYFFPSAQRLSYFFLFKS